MEVTELSSQLKTVDIVDKQANSPPMSNRNNKHLFENRRLTRSQSIPKSELCTFKLDSYIQKPAKKILNPEEEVKKIYLNNKIKIVHKNLETILEDPVVRKGNTMFLGMGKQKRSLYLCREFRITTKQKSRQRKKNIKRLGMVKKPLRMTDDEFKAKMLEIDNYLNTSDEGWSRDGTDNDSEVKSMIVEMSCDSNSSDNNIEMQAV